jgi:TM2 domain-containing membrane protein YozV
MYEEHIGHRAPYSKIVTALLAFFLGAFGVHHFYLGQKGRGILYLLFFWTIVPGMIAFVEGILFLLMDDEEFDYRYNDNPFRNSNRRKIDLRPTERFGETTAYRSNEGAFETNQEGKISIADEIEKLHDLMLRGIISEREFADRKDRLR